MSGAQVRRSSLYTIRGLDPRQVQEVAGAVRIAVQDQGETSVGFRAARDFTALHIAHEALRGLDLPEGVEVTTGFGVHRRTVGRAETLLADLRTAARADS